MKNSWKKLFFIIHPECEVKIELRSERKKAKKSCQKNEKETKLKQGEKNRKTLVKKFFPQAVIKSSPSLKEKKILRHKKEKWKEKSWTF